MAPKKRSAAEIERLKSVSTRVTRSTAARLLLNSQTDSAPVEPPKKKQKKNEPKSKPAGETSAPKEESLVPKAESPVPSAPVEPPKKNEPNSKPAGETSAPKEESPVPKAESPVPKAESPVPKADSPVRKVESPVASKNDVGGSKTIVIEHCKQCTQFKKRAVLVKEALEKDIPGITVLVNPEKPRRGCFEVREEGGEVFISLLDMKRPFQPMKDLDMDEVIKNIIEKIK